MCALELPNETRLLCLAAGRDNDADIERVIASGIDWPLAFTVAERANAFPVFWRRLAPFAARVIPSAIAEQMQRRSFVAEFTLRNQERLLEQSLLSLGELGIDVLLLKGAALAATVYGSFVRRPMGDVDILVEPKDAMRVRDRLLEGPWEWHRDRGLDDFYAGHQHLPPLFDRARTGASLEIHTDLLSPGHPFGSLAELMWSARRSATVGNAPTWAPDTMHLLLHSCLHFAWSNGLEGSAWNCIRDVDAMSRSTQVGWQEFTRLAKEVKAQSSAFWTLRFAKGLAGAAVPDEVMGELAPRRSRIGLNLLERHFVAGMFDGTASCPSTRARRALWEAAIEPTRSGHGEARPWSRHGEYTPAIAPVEPAKPERGRQAGAWRRYFSALIGAG